MFRIYADGQAIHHPNLFAKGVSVVDPELHEALNTHGSLRFSLPKSNPFFRKLSTRKTMITVHDDDGLRWRGRVISIERGMAAKEEVYCEGALAFMTDTIYRPFVYRGTVVGLLQQIIANHNIQVDSDRQFVIGSVTVTDPNDYILRSSENAQKTWDLITDALLDRLGGYLSVRYEGRVTYIDYLENIGNESTQSIEFGKNLLDMVQQNSAEEVVTCLIPYGAEYDENDADHYEPEPQSGSWDGNRVTIRSVNDGLDYVESEAGVEVFGRVWGTEVWDDVTQPQNLLTKALARVEELVKAAITVSAKAVDLHLIDTDVEAFRLGDKTEVFSRPQDMHISLQIREWTLKLMDVGNSELVLGADLKLLSNRG